jgi:hypothetical protein
LANALHLLPHRSAGVDSVSIELDSHRIRVETVQICLQRGCACGFDPELDIRRHLPLLTFDARLSEAARRMVLTGLCDESGRLQTYIWRAA